jgi:hypothetical protein
MSLLFSHPIKKLTLAAAFGIGYTLGAKAGRERYEQIKKTAQQVKDDPRVQDAAGKAEEAVRGAASAVTDDPRVQDVVQRAESLLGDAKDGTLVDQAKDVANDAVDKATDVASDVKDAADDGTLVDKAKDVADDAKHKASDVADQAAPKPRDPSAGADQQSGGSVNPLLADEHIAIDDEIVYSAGPDIEESIDELAPGDGRDRI